jgi:hypothetical protein
MIKSLAEQIEEVVVSMRNLSAKDAAKWGIAAGLESPYYFYGQPVDINRQMIERDKGSTKGKVYPAIALRLPSNEEVKGGLVDYDINIGIFAQTKLEYDATDRYANVIKPILYPLYELFLDRLNRSGFIWSGDLGFPPHTKRDMLHHGVEATQGNTAYIFDQPLDAIEVINLRINNNIKFC